MERVCENCGFPDEELVNVHRMYVTPETWDTPRAERIEDGTELWCMSCMSQYPHRVAGADPA